MTATTPNDRETQGAEEPPAVSDWSEFPDAVAAETPDEAADLVRLTDLGNAQRLKVRCEGDVRYVAKRKEFIVYRPREGVWRADEAAVRRRAHDSARAFYRSADRETDAALQKAIATFALKSMNRRVIEDAVAVYATLDGVEIEPEALDTNVGEFIVGNGVVNLKTGELRPWRSEDYATKRTRICYVPTAACARWLQFLDEVFCGDAELIAFVKRAVGYAMTAETTDHVAFMFHGGGQNGKSVLLATLQYVFGEYATPTEFSTFAATRDDGGRARDDIARLAGARLVCANEGNRELRLDEGLVKSMTGADKKPVRGLYQRAFVFEPRFRLMLATNHLPRIAGTDEGIWRRIKRVPFKASFPVGNREERLAERLQGEAPGILAWAVQGAQAWYAAGLGTCTAVDAATAEYRAGQDVIAAFLDDRCVIAPDAEAGGGELYAAFKDWTQANGESVMRNRDFAAALVERRFTKTKGRSGARWKGLTLKTSDLFEGPECDA